MKRKLLIVFVVVLLLASTSAALAARHSIRLVCQGAPVVTVRQARSRWIVIVSGDCSRTDGAPEAESAPYLEPTFDPYPEPEY